MTTKVAGPSGPKVCEFQWILSDLCTFLPKVAPSLKTGLRWLLIRRGKDAKAFGNHNQLGQGLGLDFFHHPVTVGLRVGETDVSLEEGGRGAQEEGLGVLRFDDLDGRGISAWPVRKIWAASCFQMILQFGPAHARHLDIQEDAAGARIIGQAFQQLFCQLIGFDRIAAGAQEAAGRGPERRIVVDDVNDRRHGSYPRHVLARGRLT